MSRPASKPRSRPAPPTCSTRATANTVGGHEIAAIDKARWQVELLFRWVRQHLKLRRFLTRPGNGIRPQLIVAVITWLLLRIAARNRRLAMPAIRFAQRVVGRLFVRKPVDKIDRPPDVHPATARGSPVPGLWEFSYARLSPDSPALSRE
jgi:putative transposase